MQCLQTSNRANNWLSGDHANCVTTSNAVKWQMLSVLRRVVAPCLCQLKRQRFVVVAAGKAKATADAVCSLLMSPAAVTVDLSAVYRAALVAHANCYMDPTAQCGEKALVRGKCKMCSKNDRTLEFSTSDHFVCFNP